jgi:hypothetical protein
MYNDYMTIDITHDELDILINALYFRANELRNCMRYVRGEFEITRWKNMRDIELLAHRLSAYRDQRDAATVADDNMLYGPVPQPEYEWATVTSKADV